MEATDSRVRLLSQSTFLVPSTLGRVGLGIGPLFVPLARQRSYPPYDVLSNPMLGIRFVFEHEVGGVGLSASVCCVDGVQTCMHYVRGSLIGPHRD